MREPYALKGARTVPGRGEGGNTLSLFDGGGGGAPKARVGWGCRRGIRVSLMKARVGWGCPGRECMSSLPPKARERGMPEWNVEILAGEGEVGVKAAGKERAAPTCRGGAGRVEGRRRRAPVRKIAPYRPLRASRRPGRASLRSRRPIVRIMCEE